MLFLGFKITERHNTVLPVIGAFEKEKEAASLVTWLSWSLPVALTVASLIDWLLACAYLTVCHPWRGILAEEPQVREGRVGSILLVITGDRAQYSGHC